MRTYEQVGELLSTLQSDGWSFDDLWSLVRHEASGFTPDDLLHVKAWIGPPPEEADNAQVS